MAKRTIWVISFDQRSVGLETPNCNLAESKMKKVLSKRLLDNLEVDCSRSDLVSVLVTGSKPISHVKKVARSISKDLSRVVIDNQAPCLVEKYDTRGNQLEEEWYNSFKES